MSTEPDPPPSSHSPAGPRSCEIALQNPCRYPEAKATRWRPWLDGVVGEIAPQAETLAVRFTSDREMRRLNGAYRQRDRPTDVLSFPGDLGRSEALGSSEAFTPSHLGDIAVSVPTARRQASELGHSVDRELRILLLHGILHCLGHDHETDGGVMERIETRLRGRFVGDD